jgi:putative toxin-antitoxin system antitoxin component (TIGR02293 family)
MYPTDSGAASKIGPKNKARKKKRNSLIAMECSFSELSDTHMIRVVRSGIPSESVVVMAEKMKVTQAEIAAWLHTTPRTLQRHINESTKFNSEMSDRIAQLNRVYCRCEEVFKDAEKAATWLNTPNYALGDVAPTSLLDTITGINMVLSELGRIEHGVFI